jgi:hypothetical protein
MRSAIFVAIVRSAIFVAIVRSAILVAIVRSAIIRSAIARSIPSIFSGCAFTDSKAYASCG